MKKLIILFFVFSLISMNVLGQQTPPSLDDSHFFYGDVQGLSTEGYTLRTRNGIREFSVPITSGQYGYSPVLRVQGVSGDTLKFFVVSSSGLDIKEVGAVQYQAGGVTELDFQYTETVVSQGQVLSPQPSEEQNISQSDTVAAPIGEQAAAQTCMQQWSCGAWSLCVNGIQSRSCQRVDTCDQDLAMGIVSQIVEVSKPVETQACQAVPVSVPPVTAPVVQQLCTPGAKQCQGITLQQCASDGSRWNILQTCSAGCDSALQQCTPVSQETPRKEQPSFAWGTVIIIFAVLIIIIGGAAAYLIEERKKYTPLKQYILKARGEGYSDQQIRTSLVASGWNLRKVDSYLRR